MRKGARDWRVGRFPKRLQDGSRVGSDPPFRILANGTRRVPSGAGSVPASPTSISIIYRSRGMTPLDQDMVGGSGRIRGTGPAAGSALGSVLGSALGSIPGTTPGATPGTTPKTAPKPVGSRGGSSSKASGLHLLLFPQTKPFFSWQEKRFLVSPKRHVLS